MTPNDLRALADALADEDFELRDSPMRVRRKWADYLRAQADVQPVAWMYEHDGCVDMPLFTVNRWTKCEEPWNESPLFLHPAPAVPQAEPKREDQPLRDLLAVIHCDGGHHTEAVGIEQSIKDAQAAVCELKRELAMEKREPLTYEQLVSACYTYSHNFGLLDPDEQEIVIEEAGRWAKALGIGGSDAE